MSYYITVDGMVVVSVGTYEEAMEVAAQTGGEII